jgi:hypothetical protein
MKYQLSIKRKSNNGKLFFYLALALLIFVVLISIFLRPPKFTECSKELDASCVCPAEEKFIGRRNIIFVDATDEIVKGKIEDVYRLIRETAFSEVGLLQWLKNDRRVDKTAIYILADRKPVDMTPVATYCSFPPDVTWLLTDLSANKEEKIKKTAVEDIKNAINKIENEKSSTKSYIVEGLAVATSNSSHWTAGSKLILASDLYENGPSCGFFETESIPKYSSVKQECKRWVEILGENMTRVSENSINKQSSISICQFLSKKQTEGLVSFWRELFQSQLGYDVKITCDPNQIQDRHNFLNK